MNPHLHPEGLGVLKAFGMAALVIALFVLRFSSWPSRLLVTAIERAPEFGPDKPPKSGKSAARRRQKEQWKSGWRLFKWTAVAVVCAAIIDLFLVPENLRIGLSKLWPMVSGALTATFLILMVGPAVIDGTANWRKWTFWTSVLTTATAAGLVAFWFESTGPRSVYAIVLAGLLTFIWTFGTLRRIDRLNVERKEAAQAARPKLL